MIPFRIDGRKLLPSRIDVGVMGDNMSNMLVFDIPYIYNGLQKRVNFKPISGETTSSPFLISNKYLIPQEITNMHTVQINVEFWGDDGIFVANTSMSTVKFGDGIKSDQTFVPEEHKRDFIELRGNAVVDGKNVGNEIVFYNIDGQERFRVHGGTGGGGGTTGFNGWSPILAIVIDGERRVQKLSDWTGGTGVKPTAYIGQYIGQNGFVADIAQAVDIRGGVGAGGAHGQSGFSPEIEIAEQSLTTYTLNITDKNGTFTTPNLQGKNGVAGIAATVSVGETKTLTPDIPASVTERGTPQARIFDFNIPRGATGQIGPTGNTGGIGPQGPRGESFDPADLERINGELEELRTDVGTLNNTIGTLTTMLGDRRRGIV